MIQVFCPYMEVLWMKFPASLKTIALAGFNGIEAHLIGRLFFSLKRLDEVWEEAGSLGLDFRTHEGWTWKTGERLRANYILRGLGALVPEGTRLADKVRNADSDDVVVYGSNLEFYGSDSKIAESWPVNYSCQTASLHTDGHTYAGNFNRFKEIAIAKQIPIVIDTMHFNAWLRNTPHASEFPTDSKEIWTTSEWCWKTFHGQTKEMHIADWDPSKGDNNGRNVFPGTGVFNIKKWADMVRSYGWNGIITPEVQPKYLKGDNLRRLCGMMHELFY